MNIELLKKSDLIIFEAISGSHSYGTNIPSSDIDIRGLFKLPKRNLLSLKSPIPEVSDTKQDVKYYNLTKFFELLLTANPNILEMLYLPDDCIKIMTPPMQKLIDNRNMFITKKAYHSHNGYAFAQIEKAKGQNKWVNNKKSEIPPKKEDFCFIINPKCINDDLPPFRPVPLNDTNVDLSEFHCARLEQCQHIYRLYYYGKEAKGVFRGDAMLTTESISLEDEVDKFYGLLIYNQDLFEKTLTEWNQYWEWFRNRNKNRWIDQEKGLIDYDAKNMMHCARLILSGKSIFENGYPIVRFSGSDLQFLRDIRSAKFTYEEIIKWVENEMAEMKKLYEKSDLPWGVDIDKADALYNEILDM